jgi:hypothetical protein
VQDPQRRHRASLHRQGMHWSLRGPSQQRIGLPPLPDAPDQRPNVIAMLDALDRPEGDQLFGKPIRRRLRQPAGLSQRGQAQPIVRVGQRAQYSERTVKHSPASARVQHSGYRRSLGVGMTVIAGGEGAHRQ